jgi:NAD(P) transhydrogenase subunit beta
MNAMPQMVALLNGFGGLASALVAWSDYSRVSSHDIPTMITLVLGASIGMLTFTGSCLAYGKLEGWVSPQPVIYPFQQMVNLILGLVTIGLCILLVIHQSLAPALWALLAASFIIGIVIILPIGGADMPVVISLLNSFSGVAGAMTGFVLMNNVLIIGGALVGASGLILTEVMCKAMNRSLANVLFGAFGKVHETVAGGKGGKEEYENVKSATPEEAVLILDTASLVILVPGYGLAVSRAQYSLRELAKTLQERGVTVKYAIHPVAGRMPGHMNVLLAEAEVPYEELFEMDVINPEFEQADAAIVVGANDVTNPRANTDPTSPIYGMPVLNVSKAKSILVIKRSLAPGFSGIKNPLFENEKTMMLFGDAKPVIEQLTKELKNL